MAYFNPLQGLQVAGRTIDPNQDPWGYNQLLRESYDERVRQQQATADEALSAAPPEARAQALTNETWNRAREAAATGPSGFARQWVPFYESQNVLEENLGKPVRTATGTLNLPTSTYSGVPGTTLQGVPGNPMAGLMSAYPRR